MRLIGSQGLNAFDTEFKIVAFQIFDRRSPKIMAAGAMGRQLGAGGAPHQHVGREFHATRKGQTLTPKPLPLSPRE